MIIKLVIAGIKWSCRVPDVIFNEAVMSFAGEFSGKEDIRLELRYARHFDQPVGKSITKEILEWYLNQEDTYQHYLIKREEDSSKVLVTLKAKEDWSDILIETVQDNPASLEVINLLLLEIAFRNRLLFHEGLVMHSSSLEYKGEAVAFTAPSGTGKSTHVRLWQQEYPVTVINDDHPAVRIIDGKPVVFGTPWAGEARKYCNMSSPLKGVVILEQGAHNKIRKVNGNEIIRELMPRCFLPYYNIELFKRAADIFTQLIKYIQVYKLICRPDLEAVRLVQDYVWS